MKDLFVDVAVCERLARSCLLHCVDSICPGSHF